MGYLPDFNGIEFVRRALARVDDPNILYCINLHFVYVLRGAHDKEIIMHLNHELFRDKLH